MKNGIEKIKSFHVNDDEHFSLLSEENQLSIENCEYISREVFEWISLYSIQTTTGNVSRHNGFSFSLTNSCSSSTNWRLSSYES